MRYGFFNSEMTGTDENGMPIFDRAEQADFFAKYFSSFVRNGVMPDSFNASVSGRVLTLSPGVTFIEGYFGWESESTVLNLNDGNYVITAKLDLADRKISINAKPADSSPVRSGDIYELYLYNAVCTDGVITLSDYRTDDTLCGRMGAHNPQIFCGTAEPSDSFGENGDIYIMY